MSRIDPAAHMTLDEYVDWESRNVIKHEYVSGEVFAMSGVTSRHNLITLNVVRALHGSARRRGCRVFATDVKLSVAETRMYYPDVMVACGKAASIDLIVKAPSILVEVTSPSTRTTDRREKLDAYMRLPSLAMYLIVEQKRRQVFAYTRDEAVGWVRSEYHGDDIVPISSLGTELTLDDIYDDIDLPPLRVGEDIDDEGEWID